MKTFALAFALFGLASGLRCYQGRQNASIPVQGAPKECAVKSDSCTMTLNMATKVVTRDCQVSNCTLNGMLTMSAICTSSAAHDGGSLTACCCYSDGCNEDEVTIRMSELKRQMRVLSYFDNAYSDFLIN